MLLLIVGEDIWNEEFSELSFELFILLRHIDGNTVDKIGCIWDFWEYLERDRCIFIDLSFDEHERIFDGIWISTGFFERDLEDIGIESSSREVLDLFRIEDTIRHEDDFPFSTHDFGIVQIDLLHDSFEIFHSDCLPDLEGLTHDDREASEEVRDDILAREGEDDPSDPRSGKETTRIDPNLIENEKSSSNPYEKNRNESDRWKEFPDDQVLHREGILDLMEDEARDIRDDQDDEKSTKYLIDIIDEGPSTGSKVKNICLNNSMVDNHQKRYTDDPGEEIPQMRESIFHHRRVHMCSL